MDTTWKDRPTQSIEDSWDMANEYRAWFEKYFERAQQEFDVYGDRDTDYGPDKVRATSACLACGALIDPEEKKQLNAHRSLHDRLGF